MQKTRACRIEEFGRDLERSGLDGAIDFVKDVLVPLATKDKDTLDEEHDLSLWYAAQGYADSSADQDTSAYQLWQALTKLESDQNAMFFD